MSLKGRLGNAVQKRIEALPRVQAAMTRSERTMPVHAAAMAAARRALDEEAAKAMLGGSFDAEPEVL